MITAAYLLHALFRGRRAGDNPWGSRCFEWRTTSPPPTHNFHATPVFEIEAYDYTQPYEEAA